MGYWQIIYLLIFSSSLLLSHVHSEYRIDSLDQVFLDYANSTLSKHRTDRLYEVVLPSNFSDMDLSVIRIRSSTFWKKGVEFGCFHIPKRVIPMTYEKRIAIVYENLGTLSNYYFRPPSGYKFVAPVIGFEVYDATNVSSLGTTKLTLIITGDTISINFTSIMISNNSTLTPKCVKLSPDGSILESTNMTKRNVCFSEDSGHFSVVVPSPTTPEIVKKKKNEKVWQRWVVGLAAGLGILGLLIVVMMVVLRLLKKRKVRKMEEVSEKEVALDRIIVGRSVMPCAAMIRTQPTIENDLVP
ncbi:hypothetical protein ACFE04_026659 [Oxalis oulophora]